MAGDMSAFTRLYLLRHGEVEAAYQRVFGGRLDIGLSPWGEQQAAALAECLAEVHFDAIYVSPLRRAQLTARPFLGRNGNRAETVEDLQEFHFGLWTGLGWEEVAASYGWSAFDWLEAIDRGEIPGGETGVEVLQRVGAVLRGVRNRHAGQVVALVCHGGVIRAALAWLLELPLPRTAGFEIDYASITVVEWHERRPVVRLLNQVPWRR